MTQRQPPPRLTHLTAGGANHGPGTGAAACREEPGLNKTGDARPTGRIGAYPPRRRRGPAVAGPGPRPCEAPPAVGRPACPPAGAGPRVRRPRPWTGLRVGMSRARRTDFKLTRTRTPISSWCTRRHRFRASRAAGRLVPAGRGPGRAARAAGRAAWGARAPLGARLERNWASASAQQPPSSHTYIMMMSASSSSCIKVEGALLRCGVTVDFNFSLDKSNDDDDDDDGDKCLFAVVRRMCARRRAPPLLRQGGAAASPWSFSRWWWQSS